MEIITRCKSTMMKPARHPLHGAKVPMTVFDRAAMDDFVTTVFAYRAPAPSNEALKDGLLRAVAAYPHLAGRLAVDDRGQRFLHVNNAGVLVVEATVRIGVADVLAGGANVDDLHPTRPAPEDVVVEAAAPFQIQLTRCRCGGLVVGLICHHHVADGHSMSFFSTAWASAVREGAGFAVPSPFLDRAAAAVPRRPPAPVFDHRSVEFKGSGSGGEPAVTTTKSKIHGGQNMCIYGGFEARRMLPDVNDSQ